MGATDEDDYAEELNATEEPELQIYNQTFCEEDPINEELFLYYMMIPAVITIIVHSFLVKRRRLWPSWWGGRPGVPIPVNMLDEQDKRLSYVAAFCLCGFAMLSLILNDIPFEWKYQAPLAAKPWVTLAICSLYAIHYWPIFATLASTNLIMHMWGTIYVWVIAGVMLYAAKPCLHNYRQAAMDLAQELPPIICVLYLAISIPARGIRQWWASRQKFDKKFLDKFQQLYQVQHVKQLMKAKKVRKNTEKTWLENLQNCIYWPIPHFHHSLSILTGIGLAITLNYMFALGIVQDIYWLQDEYDVAFREIHKAEKARDHNRVVQVINEYLPSFVDASRLTDIEITNWLAESRYWYAVIKDIVYTSLALALLINVVSLIFTLRSYRRNLLQVYRGIHKEIPRRSTDSPQFVVVLGCRFVGYQAAHALWGFIVAFVAIGAILFAIVLIFSLIIRYKMIDLLYWFLQNVLPFLVTLLVFQILQQLFVKYSFLLKGTDGEHCLGFNNRRCFFNYQYFMVFFNTAIGLFSCLLRIIKSIVFGIWLIPRLDCSTLSRKFERFDVGFISYVSLIKMENHHTNPILVVFTSLLLESVQKSAASDSREPSKITTVEMGYLAYQTAVLKEKSELKSNRSKTIRNKWLLAMTLVNNPGLRSFRAHPDE